MFLLGVCLTALSFIMQAAAGLFTMFSGGPVSWGSLMSVSEGLSLVIYMALNTVTSVVTTPFMFLLIAMFYLDLRIRKEALDLEWSAHVSTPQETSTGANAQSPGPQLESFGHRSGSEMQTGFAAAAFDSTGSVTTVPQALSAELVNTGLGSPQAQEPQRHGSQAQTPPVVAPMAQTRPLPVAQVDFPPGNQPQALTRTPQVAEQSSPVQPPVSGSGNLPSQPVTANEAAVEISAATCPQCNAAVRKGQTFCMQCGARLAPTSSVFGSPLE
jgi:hypothetical protein